jgi:hypothetical protein
MPLIRHALDLSKTAWKAVHGDVVAYGTWWLADDVPWPCMVLVPTFARLSHERVTPCVISVDLAWIWSEEAGDPEFAAETAMDFAESLGFNRHDIKTVMRIAGIVRDHIGDLMAIPPRPPELRRVVADALVSIDGGRIQHLEIAGHV